MRGNILSPEYMLSNAIALLLLVLAIKRPLISRAIISLIFLGAGCYNGILAIYYPARYLVYADLTASPLYETFIRGAFSRHITSYIMSIAVMQLITGILIGWKRGWMKAALGAAAFFLIAIAPLGAGSAFPCSALLAIACMILIFDAGNESLPDALYRKYLNGADYDGKYK